MTEVDLSFGCWVRFPLRELVLPAPAFPGGEGDLYDWVQLKGSKTLTFYAEIGKDSQGFDEPMLKCYEDSDRQNGHGLIIPVGAYISIEFAQYDTDPLGSNCRAEIVRISSPVNEVLISFGLSKKVTGFLFAK